jgi:hypothetical protein
MKKQILSFFTFFFCFQVLSMDQSVVVVDHFSTLPPEMLLSISQHLPLEDVGRLKMTSKELCNTIEPSLDSIAECDLATKVYALAKYAHEQRYTFFNRIFERITFDHQVYLDKIITDLGGAIGQGEQDRACQYQAVYKNDDFLLNLESTDDKNAAGFLQILGYYLLKEKKDHSLLVKVKMAVLCKNGIAEEDKSKLLALGMQYGELDPLDRLAKLGFDFNQLLCSSKEDRLLSGVDKVPLLSFVAAKGYDNIVEFLLKQGCDPDMKDDSGRKAFDYAIMHKQYSIAWQLMNAGNRIYHTVFYALGVFGFLYLMRLNGYEVVLITY